MDYVKNIDLCRCLSLLLVVCTQKVEEFTAPVAGKYKLQCWGAEGQYYNNGVAGKGGYAEGPFTMTKRSSIYICVGGYGNCYNNQVLNLTEFPVGSSGGGATSITTTNRGQLKKYKSFQGEVLLVAGGGGAWDSGPSPAGAGGGLTGVSGTASDSYGTGGSQTKGGTTILRLPNNVIHNYQADFGYGGNCSQFLYGKEDFGAQGGGGWYGGCGSQAGGAAGGGSSYIGGVTNGKTIAGDSTDPKQPTPDGNSVQVGQSGDGACVITQLSFN